MAKLLQIHNEYLQPGGEILSVERAERHLSRRHEVEKCRFSSRDWQTAQASRRWLQPFRTIYNRESARILSNHIDRFQPDALLIHNLYPVGSPSLYAVAQRRGIPVIQYLHNYRPLSITGQCRVAGRNLDGRWPGVFAAEIRHRAWNQSLAKSLLLGTAFAHSHLRGWPRRVDAWIGVSEFVANHMRKNLLPPERVHAIHDAWDPAPGSPNGNDEGYYVFLGRLTQEKGVDTLLEAWERLMDEGSAPRLVIGGDGPMGARLQKVIAERNLPIDYRGWLETEAKRQLVAGARAVVVPSTWWEPLGLVVYEAYEQEKPVLAAASGGLTETVHPGETGWLHEPGHAEQLAEDVRRCETLTAAERESMGRAGRQWLEAHTGAEQWLDRFDQVLATVTAL